VNHEGFLKFIFTGFYKNDSMCHIQASHSGPPFLHAIRTQLGDIQAQVFYLNYWMTVKFDFVCLKNDSQEITVFSA